MVNPLAEGGVHAGDGSMESMAGEIRQHVCYTQGEIELFIPLKPAEGLKLGARQRCVRAYTVIAAKAKWKFRLGAVR